MKKIGRYRRKKQKKLIIIGSMSLLLFLCVGYAAFSTNLSMNAKGNIKERTDFYVSANGSDINGYGTKEKPYATIQKAYNSVKEKANIYIMTDLKISETVLFDQNKNITLKSENGNYKLTRDNMKDYILKITSGEINISNLTFDGENKEAQASLLRSEGTENNIVSLTLGENTIFQNNIDLEDHGGGTSILYSNVIIDGTKFLNNNANYGGGGFIARYSDVTINYAEFIGNEAGDGGAIYFGDKTLTINDVLIQNNSSLDKHDIITNGGAIGLHAATMNMYNGKIIDNKTDGLGGGIFASVSNDVSQDVGSTLNIYKGEISGNSAAVAGGGIYVSKLSIFNNQNAIIKNNTPDNIYYSPTEN